MKWRRVTSQAAYRSGYQYGRNNPNMRATEVPEEISWPSSEWFAGFADGQHIAKQVRAGTRYVNRNAPESRS